MSQEVTIIMFALIGYNLLLTIIILISLIQHDMRRSHNEQSKPKSRG